MSWLWAATGSWHAAGVLWGRYLDARRVVTESGHDPEVLLEKSPDIFLIRTVAFLGGVALEALLKGLAVKFDASVVEQHEFYSHDVVRLAALSATSLAAA